jgi:hypothetical protein
VRSFVGVLITLGLFVSGYLVQTAGSSDTPLGQWKADHDAVWQTLGNDARQFMSARGANDPHGMLTACEQIQSDESGVIGLPDPPGYASTWNDFVMYWESGASDCATALQNGDPNLQAKANSEWGAAYSDLKTINLAS